MPNPTPPSVGVEQAIVAARSWTPAERMAFLAGLGADSRPLSKPGRIKFSIVVDVPTGKRTPARRRKPFQSSRFSEIPDTPSQEAT